MGAGQTVTFAYSHSDHAVSATVEGDGDGTGVEPGDEDLARSSLREDLDDEVFYFVMPDRFANGDETNDTAGIPGDRFDHGHDPTDKGYYHGGDLAGLQSKLDYVEGLGVTSIWMTPSFKNRPVQGSGDDITAGYHGYWITDFTQVDPHFGTNDELKALIAAAHDRGMKVFFDIITNHTADIIAYEGDEYAYRSKEAYPYLDADGNAFDDRDFAGGDTFPEMDPATSFPYVPTFDDPADASVKVPAWLNDVTLYHNRGNSTFSGESSEYGDFFGLDDLFTERPEVVAGMIDIHENWISEFGIDGFRVDTVKHVNTEFWQAFAPAILEHAASLGDDDFFLFGEVFDGDPEFLSRYTTEARLPAVLDFGFQGRARAFASQAADTTGLRDFFAADDYYTDADSNAYSLPTFLGNHDMGRIGHFLMADNAGASDAELLARSELAHELMYFSRGMPVVYYGDEQGFTGTGGDKDARHDMFASLVDSYNDDPLIGAPGRSTATDSYDPRHPLYEHLADLAALKAAHPGLSSGAQIHRHATDGQGVYAFSRIDSSEQVEYVVALNNAEAASSVTVPTYSANATFTGVWPPDLGAATTGADAGLAVTVPALSAIVYRAEEALPASPAAPDVLISTDEATPLAGRAELRAEVDSNGFAEVTFAVKSPEEAEWTVIGTDDNAPYRVFQDVTGLPEGTTLEVKAVVRDNAGNIDADRATFTVGGAEPPGGTARDYAIVHYQRPAGDYDGWGLYLFGDVDPSEQTTWPANRPFQGETDYGRFGFVKLAPDASEVGFIVQRDGVKDTEPDRFLDPRATPEIWLGQGDETIYSSRAAAQGYAELRYHRPDGNYDGWGLHLWGDAIADGVGTTWEEPRLPDRVDADGAYFRIPLKAVDVPVNFIVHRGDDKDTPEDRGFIPADVPSVWLESGDPRMHGSRGAAKGEAVIHYHRPDGDYGDPSSADFNDFWGLHTWAGSANPTVWQQPVRPDAFDAFGPRFRVPLTPDATELAYILHRGDTKDLADDQFLDLGTFGHEVWILSGRESYLLPVDAGGGTVDADLSKQRAHWVSTGELLWDVEPAAGADYALHAAPGGGLAPSEGGLEGGDSYPLEPIAGGPSDEVKARFPHLAGYSAFRVDLTDEQLVAALQGQLAVSAVVDGVLRSATGVQIPGVLDDRYATDADLGVTWDGAVPSLAVWAPTAQNVALELYADTDPATEPELFAMEREDSNGVWRVTGEPAWKGRAYRYRAQVYAPTTGEVETNAVTDPYSLGLSANSARSLIVDLADPELVPRGWDKLRKPGLAGPADIVLYELHVRDFSISDGSVPETLRGTYAAFSRERSRGMRHLSRLAAAGVTHLHLLPVFDIATVNDDRATHVEPEGDLAGFPPDSEEQQRRVMAVADRDGFNWGYDPWHYTVPEGSYSTDPDGPARTVQFREMVADINTVGLRVVMDVVYNHTNAAGQAEKSVLDRIVPGYYHRLDVDGAVAMSTCCPNTATEHAMMERLMVDSIVTWARDYKVDGFRFDLMGHHSRANLLAVRAALDGLTPAADGVDGAKVNLYGEGWNFGEVADNARFEQATQANMAGTGIGTFNDRLRDAVRGGGPFDADPRLQGFGSGLVTDPNDAPQGTPEEQHDRALLQADQIRVGLSGNLADYTFTDRTGAQVTGADVDYNGSPAGYNAEPSEAITYVSAHDNETLNDALAFKLPADTPMAERARMQLLALSTVALGQGTPFFHAGGDMLRSKSLDRNSYDSGDHFNRLDFSYETNNFGVGLPLERDNAAKWDFMRPLLADPALRPDQDDIEWSTERFRELLEIRSGSPLFRLGDADEVQQRVSFANTGPDQVPGLVVMRLDDSVGADLDRRHRQIVVLFNAGPEPVEFTFDEVAGSRLQPHPVQRASVDRRAREAAFDRPSGTFTVPARTTAVFVEHGR